MKEALIIIDVQNDYFPNGNCRLYESELALNTIKGLLNYFRTKGLPVFYIQHMSGVHADFFVPNTNGVQINKDIEPRKTETIIVKHYPNSFYETTLQESLKALSISKLVVCGMMTHMCVDTTVRAARDYDYQVTLISDACATKDLKWNGQSLSAQIVNDVYMASLNGRFATVISSKDYYANTADE